MWTKIRLLQKIEIESIFGRHFNERMQFNPTPITELMECSVWFGAITVTPNSSTPNLSTLPHFISTPLNLLKCDNSVK